MFYFVQPGSSLFPKRNVTSTFCQGNPFTSRENNNFLDKRLAFHLLSKHTNILLLLWMKNSRRDIFEARTKRKSKIQIILRIYKNIVFSLKSGVENKSILNHVRLEQLWVTDTRTMQNVILSCRKHLPGSWRGMLWSPRLFHKNFDSVQTSYLRIILVLIFKHIHVIGMPSALTLVLCHCHGNLILILNVKKLRHRGK